MANRRSSDRVRVMIVEQNMDFGLKLADGLAAHGYQAVLVRSVDAAIDALAESRPQAVFVGGGLSEPAAWRIDMAEILILIQTVCPRVPMVTIADQTNENPTQVIFRHGARRFLSKPVKFTQLYHVLRSELSLVPAAVASYGVH